MNRRRTPTWNEYSDSCVATLKPGNAARTLVLLSGWLLLLAGFVIALHLNAHPLARAVMAAGWTGSAAWRLYRQACGFRSVAALVLAEGGPDIRSAGRARGRCELLAGSLVFRQAGWLRLRLPGGRTHAELVLAAETPADDWRRLQILWRWGRRAHE